MNVRHIALISTTLVLVAGFLSMEAPLLFCGVLQASAQRLFPRRSAFEGQQQGTGRGSKARRQLRAAALFTTSPRCLPAGKAGG